MKQALKNRNIAILAMVVLILLGLILGTRTGLMRKKNSLQQMFNNTEFDGTTIDGRINAARRDADGLVAAAVKIVGEDNSFYKAVKDDIKNMLQAKSVTDKYYALNEMCGDAKVLSEIAIAAAEESGVDCDDVISSYKNIEHMSELLDDYTAEYNDAVDDFNNKKHAFPCNIFAKLSFVKDAEKYR